MNAAAPDEVSDADAASVGYAPIREKREPEAKPEKAEAPKPTPKKKGRPKKTS